MPGLPTKRLLVYVAAGVVVLLAGTLGLLAMRGGPAGDGVMLIDAGGATSSLVRGNGLAGTSGVGAELGGAGEGAATTTTTEPPRIWVQVAGAVRCPGVYHVSADTRVFQAIAEAGGVTEEADEDAVAMAAVLFDGCRVYVPKVGDTSPGTIVGPSASSAGVSGGSPASGALTGLVSLNSATADELDTLPGIGPALAQQIIAYREAQGPFTSIDQLTDVPGIGSAKLKQLRPLVRL